MSENIQNWAVSFLRGAGGNPRLARGIKRRGEWSVGPVNYPITELKVILGSDPSYSYFEAPDLYDRRVTAMVRALQRGWQAPPLIATAIWSDQLELSDGAHRHAALLKQGIMHYPVIFFFRTQGQMNAFVELKSEIFYSTTQPFIR